MVSSIEEQLKKVNAEKVKGMNATFQFELSGDNHGIFHVNVNDGEIELIEGSSNNPSVTFMMDAADFKNMIEGNLNATSAFMSGKLKIKGDMSLALKLQSLIN